MPREWISDEQTDYVRLAGQEALFNLQNPGVLPPGAQRCEPQVPVKAGLIGRVNPRGCMDVLRLISEWIRRPGLAVVRTLEFDFVPCARHNGKESEFVGNAKRFERANRARRERRLWKQHEDEKRRGRIGNPRQENCLHPQTKVAPPALYVDRGRPLRSN